MIQSESQAGRVVDTFFTVDVDRLFVDTEKIARIFGRLANEQFGISASAIEEAQYRTEAANKTFDIHTAVREESGLQEDDEKWKKFEEKFVDATRTENVLMPGADNLIEALEEHGAAYGYLTYAINPIYQRLKMRAAGIDLNKDLYWIVTEEDKAKRLEGMYVDEEGGYYQLPAEFNNIRARSLVQLDDKARNFQVASGRPGIRGYWVLDLATALPAQQGEVPASVRHVKNLNEVVEIEFGDHNIDKA